MEKIDRQQGVAIPLDRSNVDTDAIIPKQFLTSIKRTGFGQNLFDEWRYEDYGVPGADCSTRPLKKDFVLNDPRYKGASIMLARKNFGCGSSREHAAWAIHQYGIRVVIAPSFGDIYFQNSQKNGLLSVVLKEEEVDKLFEAASQATPVEIVVDLGEQSVSTADGSQKYHFEIDPFRKHCLINGLDDVGLTLTKADQIKAFEKVHRERFPWIANAI